MKKICKTDMKNKKEYLENKKFILSGFFASILKFILAIALFGKKFKIFNNNEKDNKNKTILKNTKNNKQFNYNDNENNNQKKFKTKNNETKNHENPTTLDSASLRPEFARPSGSGRIFRMPKIENSFVEKRTLDFTLFHPEFSIFVHNAVLTIKQLSKKFIALFVSLLLIASFVFADGYPAVPPKPAAHGTLYVDTITSKTDASPVRIADSQGFEVTTGPVLLASVAGNVGIGTTGPTRELEISDGSAWIFPNTDGSRAIALSLGHFTGTPTSLYDFYVQDSGGDLLEIKSNRWQGDVRFTRGSSDGDQTMSRLFHSDSSAFFDLYDNDAETTNIRLNPIGNSYFNTGGNVGIGTTGPSAKLHLSDTGDTQLIVEADTDNVGEEDNPSILFRQDGAVRMLQLGLVGSAGQIYAGSLTNAGYIGEMHNTPFQLVTNSAARVTITSTGNVGIGTTSPLSLLHVGSSTPAEFYFSGDTDSYSLSVAKEFVDTGTDNDYTGGVFSVQAEGTTDGVESLFSITGLTESKASNTYNLGGLRGIGSVSRHRSSGTLLQLTAAELWSGIRSGAGNVITVNNIYSGIYTEAGYSGTIDNLRENYISTDINGGTITNYYGYNLDFSLNSGSIANAYGIYLDDLVATTTFGIYQAGSDDNNYFAGNVGIGTTSPGSRLEVENTASADDVLLLQDSSGLCEAQPATTGLTWLCSSDIRLKTNVRNASDVLGYIAGIPLKDYTVIKTSENATGPIAQDLLETNPELVRQGDDGYYQVSELSQWTLVKAIQELNAENDALKNENAAILSRLAALESKVNK